MPWPLSQDYNEAVQNPAQCFSDPELKQGEAVTNALGLPVPCSGNFADVYAMQCGPRKWAVKCFTRQIPGLKERYAEISKYLRQAQLPFMVEFQFLEQGIRVHGQWYPILKMQWVEGFTLNSFVRDNLDKTQNLNTLCQIWAKLAGRLREAKLAHCDLQHGNVLLVPGKEAGVLSVRLVDYDGMCVPALELLKTIELGHPSYQHPQRLREATYDLEIDRFSHLVIYTALRAVIVGGRALWQKFDTGDNLLFTQKDFEAPHRSRVFAEVLRLQDPLVGTLTRALIDAARKPLQEAPLLENLLPALPPTQVKAALPRGAASKIQAAATDRPLVLRDFTRRKRSLAVPALLAAVVLVAGGVAAAYWFLKEGSSPDAVAAKSEPAAGRTSRPEAAPTSRPHFEPPSSQRKDTRVKPEPKLEPNPEPKPEPRPEPKTDPKPEPKPEPKPDPKPEPKPEPDKRLAVPDEAARTKAQTLIHEVFKDDYAKTQVDDMRALAANFSSKRPRPRTIRRRVMCSSPMVRAWPRRRVPGTSPGRQSTMWRQSSP